MVNSLSIDNDTPALCGHPGTNMSMAQCLYRSNCHHENLVNKSCSFTKNHVLLEIH